MTDGGISTGNPFDGVWAHWVLVIANQRTRSTVKKLIVFTILAGLFSANVYADWDPALEAREAAGRKAEQQRAAKKATEYDKMIREGSVKAYRKELGKDAVGRTDAEVERIYKQREADILKQAAAFSSSGNAMASQSQKLDPNTRSQRDAQAKSMTGKSVTELERMNSKELEAFTRDMEKKYGK